MFGKNQLFTEKWVENIIFIKICRDAQVHHILNELVMGGMVLETNMTEIMLRIEEQNKLEKEEVGFSLPYTHFLQS